MTSAMLVRFQAGEGAQIGLLQDRRVSDVTAELGSLAAWLRASVGRVPAAIDDLTASAGRSAW